MALIFTKQLQWFVECRTLVAERLAAFGKSIAVYVLTMTQNNMMHML